MVEQALRRQRPEHPLAVRGDPTDGEHGVDGGHHELDPALRRVHREPAPDADVDVVAELGPGHVGQRAVDRATVVAEEHAVEPGLHTVAAARLLDEREIGVPVRRALEVLHLAAHPHLRGERLAHRVADERGDLTDGERRLRGFVVELERRLFHGETDRNAAL